MADNDLTYGIDPWQSVQGMVHDYEKKVAREEAAIHDPDITDGSTRRSEMDPDKEGTALVAKGRLDPNTGREIPLTAKASRLTKWVPSAQFQRNYQQIVWD